MMVFPENLYSKRLWWRRIAQFSLSNYTVVQLSTRGTVILKNEHPGSSELLRMTSKTMKKDTKEKMATNMEMIGKF